MKRLKTAWRKIESKRRWSYDYTWWTCLNKVAERPMRKRAIRKSPYDPSNARRFKNSLWMNRPERMRTEQLKTGKQMNRISSEGTWV